MKTINVFQCELNETIQLEYIGKVKYIGESFGVDSLTNDNKYDVVKNLNGNIAVVDDSGEDYIYSLKNPAPADESSKGGIFHIIDDPQGVLKQYIG